MISSKILSVKELGCLYENLKKTFFQSYLKKFDYDSQRGRRQFKAEY